MLEAIDGTDRHPQEPQRHRARIGDRLLLCSDGISDYLDDDEITRILSTSSHDVAVEALVSRALHAGSRDNVSAIVADVTARNSSKQGWCNAL